jgi:valyl-tRNA synthetase
MRTSRSGGEVGRHSSHVAARSEYARSSDADNRRRQDTGLNRHTAAAPAPSRDAALEAGLRLATLEVAVERARLEEVGADVEVDSTNKSSKLSNQSFEDRAKPEAIEQAQAHKAETIVRLPPLRGEENLSHRSDTLSRFTMSPTLGGADAAV